MYKIEHLTKDEFDKLINMSEFALLNLAVYDKHISEKAKRYWYGTGWG